MESLSCKICKSTELTLFAHTAACGSCGVLLYYPYPEDDRSAMLKSEGKSSWKRKDVLGWYSGFSFFNHANFTNMTKFVMDESYKRRELNVLDYGGGGGQFALICKSLFPESRVFITDISDESLLDEWKTMNNQILFRDFESDQTKFDVIFLNDVFEHVSDPLFVLKQLSSKLKENGRLFIDTPRQFWIYPLTRTLSKALYTKVLRGTVSRAHLQIWSKKSFDFVVNESKLEIEKYREISEYTMPADSYLVGMGIKNPIVKLVGRVFYANSKWLARNKIICTLKKI